MTNLIPHPMSGEVLDLESTTDTLAQWLLDLRELRQMLSSTIDTLSEELTDRLDQENTRSAIVGDWRIEGKAPFTTEYDVQNLRTALLDLVDEGLLAATVVERTIGETVTFKVDRREVNKLLRHPSERVREVVGACGEQVPQRRSVTIKRAGA